MTFSVVTCDALSLPSDVQVNPAYCAYSRLTIGSRCSFSCLNGLSLSNDVSSVVCEDDGTWSAEMSDLPTHCEGKCRPSYLNRRHRPLSLMNCASYHWLRFVRSANTLALFHCFTSKMAVSDTYCNQSTGGPGFD